MEIAVIGATVISSVIAGYLKNSHGNVTCIAVPNSTDTVKEFTVKGTNLPVTPRISFSTLDSLDGTYDFILIFTQPNQNEAIIPAIKKQLKKTTIILSFQLTLSDDTLVKAFSENPVISAICHFNASYRGRDMVFLTTKSHEMQRHGFNIQSTNEQHWDELIETKNFLDFIAQTNIIGPSKNIKWSYALYLVAFDRLASALNCSFGDILHHKIALETSIHLADEVGRIAHKHYKELIQLDTIDFNKLMIDSDTKTEEISTQFKELLQAHITSESTFKYDDRHPTDIIDELIYHARKIDQPTPYIDILSHCLHYSQKAPFHENIQIFEPLVKGLAI
ncbi:MAG: hypothetical protein KBT36_12860 [Kurthia sp.]|nr:hypothetical protein [Candidatus Kurthia equi]